MYSHFSVILLCFSGVYCISSIVENLDLNGLKQILNGETTIKEWKSAMEQNIIYNHNTKVNVKNAVKNFKQKVDTGDVSEFETIHNMIKIAYQCMLTKKASLTAFLIVQDVRAIKDNITKALTVMINRQLSFDRDSIFTNKTFLNLFEKISGRKFHFDFDLKFRGREILFLGKQDAVGNPSKEWHNIVADIIIKKELGFKIKYKIYPDVFGIKFTNQLDLPDIHVFNEIYCVFKEAIELFDNFMEDKCSQDGSDFRGLIVKTSQAPGGFIENAEFELSGLKIEWKNTKNPTEIYGRNTNERTSETILKFIEHVPRHANILNVGRVSIRDNESWLADQQSGNTNAAVIGE